MRVPLINAFRLSVLSPPDYIGAGPDNQPYDEA
jgi:hypothetical protein